MSKFIELTEAKTKMKQLLNTDYIASVVPRPNEGSEGFGCDIYLHHTEHNYLHVIETYERINELIP